MGYRASGMGQRASGMGHHRMGHHRIIAWGIIALRKTINPLSKIQNPASKIQHPRIHASTHPRIQNLKSKIPNAHYYSSVSRTCTQGGGGGIGLPKRSS